MKKCNLQTKGNSLLPQPLLNCAAYFFSKNKLDQNIFVKRFIHLTKQHCKNVLIVSVTGDKEKVLVITVLPLISASGAY